MGSDVVLGPMEVARLPGGPDTDEDSVPMLFRLNGRRRADGVGFCPTQSSRAAVQVGPYGSAG